MKTVIVILMFIVSLSGCKKDVPLQLDKSYLIKQGEKEIPIEIRTYFFNKSSRLENLFAKKKFYHLKQIKKWQKELSIINGNQEADKFRQSKINSYNEDN